MISIIHPTRRLEKASERAIKWVTLAENPKDIEYILSIDTDDQPESYFAILEKVQPLVKRFQIVVSENQNVVQAMNEGAAASTGDILVCISDDFACPLGWDTTIKNNMDTSHRQALKINDGISNVDDKILTLPILTRKLYNELGYIYYPEYMGMFADNDLAELCDKRGWLRSIDILFLHEHWLNNYYKKDVVNERHDNRTSWAQGQLLIKTRRAMF